ncbi:MAG: choice-of-anchor B domain-containing protein, partial [Gammaproteobacteria bacterium]
VSIVDLADPTNPTELFFLNGLGSTWRDIKTWGEYAYVTNESGNGVEVIDLTELPNNVSSFSWTPDIPGVGTISTCHNIWIDELGYAYLTGCDVNQGGMIYVDVFTNPGQPEYAGKGPNVYAHDVYTANNLAYTCEVYDGVFGIYDVSDKTNTVFLGNQVTTGEFTHNCWLSDDGTILFTTDEQGNAPVGSYDVTDPTNIIQLDDFLPFETLGDGVIPHNVHVWEDWLIISYYTDGCILVDGSNPSNLIEVGNFDTFIPESTGFSGAWGAYPYLPSGLVLISDIGNGMYVLEPNYVNACWLEGMVTDAVTELAISGANVNVESTNVEDQTNIGGDYATGYAISGTYDVTYSKPGYTPETVSVDIVNGEIVEVDVELTPLDSFSIGGTVIDEETSDPIPFATVRLVNEEFDYEVLTDDAGVFVLNTFFEGEYDVIAGKWGHHTAYITAEQINEGSADLNLEIAEGYEDIFSLDHGWDSFFNGNTGEWELGTPLGAIVPDADLLVTPDFDVPEDLGNHCYVTGNTDDFFNGILIGGNANLTSPVMDLSGYDAPVLQFYAWYLNIDTQQGNPGFSDMLVTMSDGFQTVGIDTIPFEDFDNLGWSMRSVDLSQFMPLTENMTISFNCSTPFNFTYLAEAAIDYFLITEGNPNGVSEVLSNILVSASPNPSASSFFINYKLHEHDSNARLEVFNATGQLVHTERLTAHLGRVSIGENFESGLYIARIIVAGSASKTISLVKQ